MQQRFWEIDFLRGISIFLVILIHCTVYYFSNPIARTIWNYAQLAVPVFIFCSFYIFFAKEFTSQEPFWLYLIKRTKRLLIPYFIFLPFFFALVLFTNPLVFNTKYIIQSITLTGGIDLNWLILLFLELTVILSLLKATKYKKYFLYPLTVCSILISLLFVFSHVPPAINYKLIMWLPWSLILGFSYLFVKLKTKKIALLLLGIVCCSMYLFLHIYLVTHGDSTIFRENKYPPNLYYLSYGMASIIFLYLLAPMFRWLEGPITFLSTYSYQLFFIHYFFLILFVHFKALLMLPWWIFFAVVLGISLTTLLVLNKLIHLRHKD